MAEQVQRRLRAIESEARSAAPSRRARLYNRAGDLCARNDLRERALRYYGASVDAYISRENTRGAMALCKKIIRFSPDVVRAHCTIACLALGEVMSAEAERAIANYVDAVQRTDTERFAIPRLRLMARATAEERIIRQIASCLTELGDHPGSEEILAALEGGGDPTASSAAERKRNREQLLEIALTDSDDLWADFWLPDSR